MGNGEFGLLEFFMCIGIFLICILLIVIYSNKISREKDIFSNSIVSEYNNIIY